MSDASYFATAASSLIGSKLHAKVERYGDSTVVQTHHGLALRGNQYYYGTDPQGAHVTSAVHRGGEYGELAEVRINHSRSLAQTLLNLITAGQVSWQTKATNIDYQSAREVELFSGVLEYYFAEKRAKAFADRAAEECIPLTEGFVTTFWDSEAGEDFAPAPDPLNPRQQKMVKSGDIVIENVSTFDVIRDPHKDAWESLDWVIVRKRRNKYDLAARYPHSAPQILDTADDPHSPKDAAKEDSDDVAVYYFFHKCCPVLPEGRATVFLNAETVLSDEKLTQRYDGIIPVHRITPAEWIGTPFGYSPFMEILGIQELSDSLHTSIATNQTTFGTQTIAVEQGTEVQIDQIAGGMRIIYVPPGKKAPEALQLTASPPEVFPHVDRLQKSMELLFGLNSVVRGEPQNEKMSGAALALLQSQALQQASVFAANYKTLLESMGNAILRILKKNCTIPRKVSLVGKQNAHLIKETEYTGQSFGRIQRVLVETGNPLSQTAAGRLEIAQQMMTMGLIKTPEQFIQVLSTGRLEPLTQSMKSELMLILSENEDIGAGTKPTALLHDDHLLHGREHRVPLSSPAARKDQKVVEAGLAHLHEHYALYYNVPLEAVLMDPLYHDRLLILMGMQPPMPMMPPGMGPPPDPNAPPQDPGGFNEEGTPPGPPPEAGPGNAASGPNMPSQPKNPATGQEWNPVDGGGAVPR